MQNIVKKKALKTNNIGIQRNPVESQVSRVSRVSKEIQEVNITSPDGEPADAGKFMRNYNENEHYKETTGNANTGELKREQKQGMGFFEVVLNKIMERKSGFRAKNQPLPFFGSLFSRPLLILRC